MNDLGPLSTLQSLFDTRAIVVGILTPSPGTPGEGWGEGLPSNHEKALGLSRRTGRGNRKRPNPENDRTAVIPHAFGGIAK